MRPKIEQKIDKNSIKQLTKTRCEQRSEKERKRAQLKRPSARKPDLAGERKATFETDGLILGAAKEKLNNYIKKLGEAERKQLQLI